MSHINYEEWREPIDKSEGNAPLTNQFCKGEVGPQLITYYNMISKPTQYNDGRPQYQLWSAIP